VVVPVVARREDDGRYTPVMYEPIEVADTSPAELSRATQAMADALEDMIAEAPEQWYTFKPMWPRTLAEGEALARRAAEAGGVVDA
jgi:lauroyl/myristoyl acyltransferase